MNSNQRSQGNNQSSNGGNEKEVSSSRGGLVEKGNIHPDHEGSQQAGRLGGASQGGMDLGGLNSSGPQNASTQGGTPRQGDSQQGSTIEQDSTSRTGSQTDVANRQQVNAGMHQPNDLTGGLPKSPRANKLAADSDMDEDTGLSNRANQPQVDEGNKQMEQSNVGRRSDMTPD